MKISEVAVDAAAISTSSKVTAGGGTAGLIGFATSINWLGVGGFVIAVLGLLVNLYFQRRRDKREREFHEAQLEILRKGGQGMKPQLIPQWKRCLRMFSIQAMVLAGAIQGAWVAIPGDLKASIGDDWMRYITIALMVAGVIGRLVVQPTVSGEGDA